MEPGEEKGYFNFYSWTIFIESLYIGRKDIIINKLIN